MSESQEVKPLSKKQYDFIVLLAGQLKAHLSEAEIANLTAKLKAADQQTSAWGSAAIAKLKRVQTQVALAKLKAQREKLAAAN